jgi:hypothetical protein
MLALVGEEATSNLKSIWSIGRGLGGTLARMGNRFGLMSSRTLSSKVIEDLIVIDFGTLCGNTV